MVIHQFNKIIRNKWVWGAFAIAISLFFAFDFLVADMNRPSDELSGADAGTLAGEPVSAKTFTALVEEIRGFGQQRDWKRNAGEVNREAWENYAALTVADRDGLGATDAEVRDMIRTDPSFQQNGAFSFARYQALLRANGLSPERFEASLKRRVTLGRIGQALLASATWTSPMELDQAIADMTDTFTVKVASFEQTKAEADAVRLDDAGLRKWYDANRESLELPERMKVRYVKFSATDPAVLAKMAVTEDEVRDRFDVTIDRYTTTDTNGVETVRKFEDLTKDERGAIERELRQIAAVTFFETNLNMRVYGQAADGKPKPAGSCLDAVAKEMGAKVETSGWFSLEEGSREGFMVHPMTIFPGAKEYETVLAELDPASEDLRYGIVSSERAVWLVEKAETSAKHVPSFDEAKEAIRPRALRDATADAFREKVEAIARKGAAAVEAVKGVSTNIVFSVADLRTKANPFENAMSVARAAMGLMKGEVSDFTLTGVGKAILVVCVDRAAGDASQALLLRDQVRTDLSMLQLRQIPEAWKSWNLERLGFVPNDISSVEAVEEEE